MPTGAYAKSPTTQTPKTPRLADGEDPAPRGARPRDEVWDALVDEFGAPETDTERKRFGKVVRELKAAGATGPQAKVRAHRARAAWPTCSVVAVSANWRLLGEGQPRRGSRPDAPEWDRGAEPGRVTL